MTLLRLLNIQGIAGIAISLALVIFLIIQVGEARHWKKQSGQFEELYGGEKAALAETVANYRAAAARAEASDRANARRVAAEQDAISERISNDYETRLAAARALAQRLRAQTAATAGNPGHGAGASVSGLSSSAQGTAGGSGEDRLSEPDAVTATEQAIQLDELIKWVKAQSGIDANGKKE